MSPRGPPIATRYACVHLSEGACVHLCACVRKRVDIFMYAVVYDLMDARYLHARWQSPYASVCVCVCTFVHMLASS